MLDTIFKNGAGRKQAQDELQALVAEAREQRAELSALLMKMKSDGVVHKCEQLAGAVSRYDERARSFEQLEGRMSGLLTQMAEAKRASEALSAPDGGLQQYRQAVNELTAQARAAQATMAALTQESEKLDALRASLRQATAEVGQATDSAATLKGELDTLRHTESQLGQELQGIREGARAARDDAAAATKAVEDVQAKLESFAQLQELSKTTETRLASLNALAEHVSHKAKALETQKHTVERAVVEATRLNEMVWNMDAQIAKLSAGGDQIQRAEETVARIEEVAQATTRQLAAASAARDEFVRESVRIESQSRSLSESLRSTVERLTIDKEEIDAFDQRLRTMSSVVDATQTSVQDVLAKHQHLAAIERKSDAIDKAFQTLMGRAEELARRQSGLDALAGQLAQVEGLGKRTAAQHESLLQSQKDIEAVRLELTEFHKAHAEAVQLRDKLAVDRAALDAFGERTATMLSRTPDLEARMDAVLGKLARVDEGDKSATRLGELAAELDAQVARVGARLQFVEKLDERVNGLHVVTAEVEQKLAQQLARRAEVESLKNLCDTLATQVVDVQQKLEGVSALQGRVLPVASQVATLLQTLERSQQLVAAIKTDEAAVQQQQATLAELVEQGRALAAETAERLKQARAVSDDLDRAAALKEVVLAELARVQGRQRDAVAQTDVADDQIKRAEAMVKQLEQRCTQLLHSEKHIAALEGRLDELGRSSEAVEHKIQSLADQEVLVQAVKAEVENIRQISGRSKADLQFVSEHRNEVTELRGKVEDLIGRVEDTDGKIELIESRRKMVEEVQSRANSIINMLDDINVNLEMLSEQRAVVDHVGEKLARLDFTVQEAHNPLRALQREREVAERIEQGIKALRTRSGTVPDVASVATS